jgi:hypothetical protein
MEHFSKLFCIRLITREREFVDFFGGEGDFVTPLKFPQFSESLHPSVSQSEKVSAYLSPPLPSSILYALPEKKLKFCFVHYINAFP